MRRINRRLQQRQLRRALDDEDWGTSSPTPEMNSTVPPSPSVTPITPQSETTPDILPVVSVSTTPLTQQSSPPVKDRSLSTAFGRLQQQDLKSYTCTFSPRCVVTIYFVIALTFIPLGASIIAATARIASTKGYRSYSEECSNTDCTLKFRPPKTIPKPSYLYYRLVNFHQNARDYVKSRSPIQNRGIVPATYEDVANCDRWLCPDGLSNCTSATNFNASKIIYPCGLTARLVFNDTFDICKDDNCSRRVQTAYNNIAWWTDSKYKFQQNKDAPEFKEKRTWPYTSKKKSANDLLDDDRFVVWMRLAAFPTFDKLYAVIQEDLNKDVWYFMKISNTFRVDEFGGEKLFYITTTTWFGSRNSFLGISYLFIGSLALIVAVIVLFKHILNPNAPANIDPSILLKEHLAKLNLDTDSYR